MTWEQFYNFFGIKDFIYYISSPEMQDMLFPVRLTFVLFAVFFLGGVVYFMLNSSWLQYKFLEDVTEFFSWQPYGARVIAKRWKKIKQKLETGIEAEYKLAVIEAEYLFFSVMQERGFTDDDIEEALKKIGRNMLPNLDEIMLAHKTRNSIVYDPGFRLDAGAAKKIVAAYESATNNLGVA